MRDKIALLMRETGCEAGEAELALEMCGFDVEKAVRAIPRLFHNIGIIKGKAQVENETMYVLFLVILNLRTRALLRARAVASFNPAICAVDLERDWFRFEKHLYASRLRDGSVQALSQEVERLLSDFFESREAAPLYSEGRLEARGRGSQGLSTLLSSRFAPNPVRLVLSKDVLDMGQFQEIDVRAAGRSRLERKPAPRAAPAENGLGAEGDRPRRAPAKAGASGARVGDEEGARPSAAGPGGPRAASDAFRGDKIPAEARGAGGLVLRISLEADPGGAPAAELVAGDLVYAWINDARDVARYLAKLFGAGLGEETPLMVPVEAVETGREGAEICVRVRFSGGVCGDVFLPPGVRLKVVRKTEPTSWWRKLFGS